MQFMKISRAFAGIAVLALAGTIASADVIDKKTTLTVKETIEVPGAILPPGEYVVKLVDSAANRHIVRFLNKEENKVLTTVIAIPNVRLKSTDKTEFAWHETPAGQPPALKAWFYPGDTFGQEFAYPEGRATELAAATQQQVAHVSDQEAAAANQRQEAVIAQAPAPRPQPDNSAAERQAAQQARERELAAQRERDMQAQRERERQIAQASQNQQQAADQNLTAQQVPQNQPMRNELPETAGFGALLALIGLGSLGASWGVRKLRK